MILVPGKNGASDADAQRRLTRQGEERKQQLLDHAARLFAERGYAETRVIDIVRAAGVAKGLFYWYFENKEALFNDLVETTRRRMRVEQANAIDPSAPPLIRIRQGVEASLRFMNEHRNLYSIFDLDGIDGRVAEAFRRGNDVHIRDTARHVQAGVAAGVIRNDDVMLLTHGVISTVAHFNRLHRTGRIDTPIDDVVSFAGRFVVRALAASDEIAAEAEAAFDRQPAMQAR